MSQPFRLRRRAVCHHCHRPRPLTLDGCCPACAEDNCVEAAGSLVGLPVPEDVTLAVEVLRVHAVICGYRPLECWTCALLTTRCRECDTPTREMTPFPGAGHQVLGRWVVVGCEGYVPGAVRAAAVAHST